MISWRPFLFLFLAMIMMNQGYRCSLARKGFSNKYFRALSTKEPLDFGINFKIPHDDSVLHLEKANQHPLDSRMKYDPQFHKYYFDGKKLKYSVTGVVKKYFEEFIPELIAEKMINSKNWPRPQYMHPDGQPFTVSDIVQEWEAAGLLARNQGSWLHYNIERFFNKLPYEAEDIPEFHQFLRFHEDIIQRHQIVPYRTEWRIAAPDLQVGGSIDFIGQLPDSSYVIMDWKRSKSLASSLDNGYKNGLPPIDHLADCDGIKYALQLNLYDYILRTHYGIDVKKLFLVAFHPNLSKYFLYEVPNYQAEVKTLLAHLHSTSQVKDIYTEE